MSPGRQAVPLVLALLALLVASSIPTHDASAGSAPPNLSGALPAIRPIGAAVDPGVRAIEQARASLAGPSAPTALTSLGWTTGPTASGVAPAMTAVSLVWDAADGYVLALAPNITGNYTSTLANLSRPSQTWSFLGGVWTERFPSSAPSSRGFAAMTYDVQDGYVVLFGGVPTYGVCLPYAVANHPGSPFYGCYSDTWTYAGGTWTNRTGSVIGSPPRYFDGTLGVQTGPEFVYDATDGYALLYGENNSETWGYSAGQWLNLTSTAGTPPGTSGSMAYDPTDGYVLYFGGEPTGWTGPEFASTSQTWEFAHGAWTDVSYPFAIQPSPRSFAAMTFDASLGEVVLFGGIGLSGGAYQNDFDTWVYQGAAYGNATPGWYELSGRGGPSPRFGGTLVGDPADHESVYFGGTYASPVTGAMTPFRETWTLSARAWASAGPLIASSRTSLDQGTNLSLMVVGLPFDALAGGQFTFLGLPPGCVGTNGPTLECVPSTTGTFPILVNFTSALGSASASLTVVVNPDPFVRAINLSRSVTEPGVPVTVDVAVVGGTGPFTYSYAQLPGCAAPNASTFRCDPTTTGRYAIGVVATDDLGWIARLSGDLTVVPDLSFGTVALAPAVTDVGRIAQVNVSLSGGLAPFTVAYEGLPPGCASANLTLLSCSPTAAGNYLLSVGASDAGGISAADSVVLRINPDPTLTGFTLSSPSIPVGGAVGFAVEVAGGTAPFSFSYSGLPEGCPSANASRLSCSPSVPGTYRVVVTATDAAGYSVSKTVSLAVRAPASGGLGGPFGGLGSIASTGFGQGLLAGLAILAVVGIATGRTVIASARVAEAARLPEELADRAEELARDADEHDQAGELERTENVP